jgi:hypothetical protein
MKLGDFEKSQNNLQQAYSILKDLGSEYESAKTILLQCQLALEQDGEFERQYLEQAYLTFEQLGAKAEINRAQLLLNQIP